jgi:hypothetical protein
MSINLFEVVCAFLQLLLILAVLQRLGGRATDWPPTSTGLNVVYACFARQYYPYARFSVSTPASTPVCSPKHARPQCDARYTAYVLVYGCDRPNMLMYLWQNISKTNFDLPSITNVYRCGFPQSLCPILCLNLANVDISLTCPCLNFGTTTLRCV